MGDERGYTLMEVLIAVGMIAMLTIGGFGFALSMKPLELSAATTQFDALVSSARSVATAFGDGATIFVTTTPGGVPNFRAQVYGHRPGGTLPLIATTVPPLVAKAAITETAEVHDPSFAIIIHGNGNVGARSNFAAGDNPAGPELGCPTPQNAFAFVFTVDGHTATRFLPCHINLAASGPVVSETPPASPTAPGSVSRTPQPIVTPQLPGSPGCPAGSNLLSNACRFPLIALPLELHFFNPTDTNPGIYDSSGNLLGSDPGGIVRVSEQNYFSSYAVDNTDCSSMIAPIPPLTNDPGTGDTFAINPLPQPPAFRDCVLAISDGNVQTPQVKISIAGPLAVFDDASQQLVASTVVAGTIVINATSPTQWQTVTLDAVKANFSPAVIVSHGQGCANYVSVVIGGPKTQPGYSETPFSITGIAPTVDSQNNLSSCTLSVADQFGEPVNLAVTVKPWPGPRPPTPPSLPCVPDAFGYCAVAEAIPTTSIAGQTCGTHKVPQEGTYKYDVYTAAGLYRNYFDTVALDGGTQGISCQNGASLPIPTYTETFSPSDPQSDTGDPNLS